MRWCLFSPITIHMLLEVISRQKEPLGKFWNVDSIGPQFIVMFIYFAKLVINVKESVIYPKGMKCLKI